MRLGQGPQSFLIFFRGRNRIPGICSSQNQLCLWILFSLLLLLFFCLLKTTFLAYGQVYDISEHRDLSLVSNHKGSCLVCLDTIVTEGVHTQRAATHHLLPSRKSIMFDFWKAAAERAPGADSLIQDLQPSASLACGAGGFVSSRGQQLVLILQLDCHSFCTSGLKCPSWY